MQPVKTSFFSESSLVRTSAEQRQKSKKRGRLIDPCGFMFGGCSVDRVALSRQNGDEIYPISGGDRL